MAQFSWLLAAVVACAIPCALLLQGYIAFASEKHFLTTEHLRAEMSACIDDTLNNQQLLRLSGDFRARLAHFNSILDAFYASGIKAQFISSLSNPSSRLLNSLLLASTIGVCAWIVLAVPTTPLSIGGIVSVIAYVQQITKPINELSSISTQLEAFYISAKRVFAYIQFDASDTKGGARDTADAGRYASVTDLADTSAAVRRLARTSAHVSGNTSDALSKNLLRTIPLTSPYLLLSHVYVSYDHEHFVLQDLNLSLHKAQTLAIVGPSGCGKSTLMQTLVGLLQPDRGEVYLEGRALASLSQEEISQQFSLVMQSSCILNASVLDNICYGSPEVGRKEAQKVAELVGLRETIEALPQGYDTILSRKHTKLSLGEIQLISIARAFIQDKPILILDEATASLDPWSEKRISQALARLMQGRTVICVAHRLSTIMHADTIVVMKEGRIIEEGTHTQLMDKRGFYYQLFSAQKL